jgi:hypothetical protein
VAKHRHPNISTAPIRAEADRLTRFAEAAMQGQACLQRWLDAPLGVAHWRLEFRRPKYRRLDNSAAHGRDPVLRPH